MLAGRAAGAAAAGRPLGWHGFAAAAAAASGGHRAPSGEAAAARAAGAAAQDPEAAVRAAFSYCVAQVKAHDYENFLWAAQLHKELRAPIFALRAFNVETALIAEHAKSEMLVLMRCQWWRDALNDCFKGAPPAQPVVTALAEVLRCGRPLTRYRLQQIVTTREEDMLGAAQPASLAALERYADGTAGQLLHLQLEAAGLGQAGTSEGTASAAHAAAAEHAAGHLGRAVGIAALLRGTAAHAARRRVYLPADLCEKHGVSVEDVLTGRDSDGLRDVALAVAAAAKQHLDEARRLRADLAPAARPLFLPAVATGMYLDALERAGFNLLDPGLARAAVAPLPYQLRLKWALLRGGAY